MQNFVRTGLVLVLFSAFIGRAEEGEKGKLHPYKTAKIGDWITYQVTATAENGRKTKVSYTLKVTEVNEFAVKMSIGEKNEEREMPPGEIDVELNKPHHWGKMGGSHYQKQGEATEKITVGGKTYDCKRTDYVITSDVPEQEVTTEKVWVCTDVALDQIVKSELTIGKKTIVRELVASGKAGK